jgi:hypothetical protein
MNDDTRRKIIQIAPSDVRHLYVLCDDGTLWVHELATPAHRVGQWRQIELPPELEPLQA